MLGVQWLFNALRHICGNICMLKFELLRLFTPHYPEGTKDTPVWLYDSWLDCRDKRVQINLLSSKWVSVTEEIKGFWSASQMTDATVLLPPQWPADKPRPRESHCYTPHAHNMHTLRMHDVIEDFFFFLAVIVGIKPSLQNCGVWYLGLGFYQWHAFRCSRNLSWKKVKYKI